MKAIIIIPARMASTRLPGKPLADIHGLPMIVHVMKRAEESGVGPVYIACAEEEIARAVQKHGGKAITTNPDHPSGTDRIYEALTKIDQGGEFDIIVNVQGDLPTIDPAVIKDVMIPFSDQNVDVTTLVSEIKDEKEKYNPNVVKAVVAWKGRAGRALYFTRATAPANDGPLYHHIGLYAYRRLSLEKFVKLNPSLLEIREKLEQLRALENNMRIDVVNVDTVPLGVDTPEDLAKAKKILSKWRD